MKKREVCYICKNEFSTNNEDNDIAFKKYLRVREYEIIVITPANVEVLLIIFVT